jgi:hypothetical protein
MIVPIVGGKAGTKEIGIEVPRLMVVHLLFCDAPDGARINPHAENEPATVTVPVGPRDRGKPEFGSPAPPPKNPAELQVISFSSLYVGTAV